MGRYRYKAFGNFSYRAMLFSVRPEATVLANPWENPGLVDSLTCRQLALTQVIKDSFWQLHESFRIFFFPELFEVHLYEYSTLIPGN